jgi:hypothetical protein
LPEVTLGAHWIAWMRGCGFCLTGNGGPIPLTFQEIESWSRITRQEVSGDEAETLRRLSELYCAMYYRSISPVHPDPCRSEDASERTMQAFKSLVERYK